MLTEYSDTLQIVVLCFVYYIVKQHKYSDAAYVWGSTALIMMQCYCYGTTIIYNCKATGSKFKTRKELIDTHDLTLECIISGLMYFTCLAEVRPQ